MSLVLTCTRCATRREPQPHEQYQAPGTQTQAHCRTCCRITAHWLGQPTQQDQPVHLDLQSRLR